MPVDSLSVLPRLWLAWLTFFRVLFDGRFAARVLAAREPPALTPTSSLTRVPTPAPTLTPALQLLAVLQRDGRLIDFLEQDITSFTDTDVGAAARVVHEGCRKALHAQADIAPVRTEEEGARVTLEAGFDADTVKLVGDVKGAPPYTGVLRHRGWRANRFELPRIVGDGDSHVLAPAEVELG